MKKPILFIAMLIAIETFSQKQGHQKTDSLFTVLKTEQEDTAKVSTMNALAYKFERNNPDTAIYFATKALLDCNVVLYY